ncbi:alpha-(1,3)-fucosyltransferase C-like [Eriocheir sinensis]|uniref:alpha-(1,3)-fucosyltransferase C-like n=1 Tax=Eriocheir sinensis TaxID=95602 RepID=UPI0021C847A1|nr:alpha-(1,3)-fucosyltransferase C-like [Eriocheir sinensis]
MPGDSTLPYPSCISEKASPSFPEMFPEPKLGTVNDTCLKKILFWNDDHSHKHFGFGFGHEPFLVAGCRVNMCTTTGDRTRYPIEKVDALVWHYRSIDRSLPEYRSPHTRYIFWMMESPSYLYGDLRDYHNVFNWTFTYRLDSDIPQPYDRVFRRHKPLPTTKRNYAEGKTKLAAWFVSHCDTESGRNRLVKTLQRRVTVDIYGNCGSLKCTKTTERSCYEMLNMTYKFYLSFENSLCRDYITEKLFNILR